MPSKTDFNVAPYYDDFTESKKFHRGRYMTLWNFFALLKSS